MLCATCDRRKGKPAASEARRFPVRLSHVAQLLLAAMAAFILALFPYGAHIGNVSPADSKIPGVSIVKSEAQAMTAYNANALPFLQKCAEASGLSIKDYMLTQGIIIAGSTGYNVLAEDTSYAADQTVNTVVKVVSTLEWPDWDDLTAEQKSSYGNNPDMYYATEFNALAGCFGLADARDVYYSSGGGDFDGETVSILQRIGDIGNRFATGAVLGMSDIYTVLKNPNSIFMRGGASGAYNNFGLAPQKTTQLDGKNIRFMASIPGVSGQSGHVFNVSNWLLYMENMTNWHSRNWVYLYYGPVQTYGPIDISIGDTQATLTAHDYSWTSGATWGGVRSDTGSTWSGQASGTYNYEPYVYANAVWLNSNYAGGYYYQNEPLDLENVNYDGVLPGTPPGTTDGDVEPDGIGAKGITPNTPYQDITGQPRDGDEPSYVPPSPEDRPQNPYNPSDSENPSYQSGTPEWKAETEENMMPLMNIRFDSLFPFCLVFDIQKLFNKVQSVTGTESQSGVYNRVTLPFWLPGSSAAVELDLSILRDLLVSARPFFQILLGALLLFTVIAFWRGILTGD